jgi:molybdate transport system substrate-binding protein
VARRLACALLALALSGACAEGAGDSQTTITVFAASSLTDAFSEMAREFERDHPQATVRLNFASSSELATQIEQGAEADVFASADTTSVDQVIDAGLVAGEPRTFARNRMTLAIPRANPGGVETLRDLDDPGLVVSLCNEECPAGKYAREVLRKAGISVSPDSLETEVRGVVTRLQTGEADAGIVYASDVVAAGEDLRAIGIPDRYNVVVPYPIVVLDGAPRVARDFVALVLSASGRQELDKQGFLAP